MVSQVRDRCNMCAGRCREPRCIRSPCRGSQRLRRALGGTRILLAAAPTAPPCFCRWQRSSLLHRGFFTRRTIRRVDAVRIHPCSPFCKTDKTETPVPIGYQSSWWARVDSNNHGFVPPKPFDSKKLGIMRIFGHPKWNTKPFRPGRNVKSGLQSGLFLGVRGVLG